MDYSPKITPTASKHDKKATAKSTVSEFLEAKVKLPSDDIAMVDIYNPDSPWEMAPKIHVACSRASSL